MNNAFARENDEIPAALANLAGYYRGEGRGRLLEAGRMAGRGRSLLFAGMGTSETTPHHVLWRLRALGRACATVDAGEWHHHGSAPRDDTLVILSSQSGESVELRNLVARHLVGRLYVAITNDPSSTLSRSAALTLPLCAGAESSITTKTYTNNLGLLDLLVAALGDPPGLDTALGRLDLCARSMETLDVDAVRAAARVLERAGALAFVGRGAGYTSARQAALTFMEGTRSPTSVYTGGAFNHGPLEAVEKGFALVVFAAAGAAVDLSTRLARRAADLGAAVVLLTDTDAPDHPGLARIPVPRVSGAGADDAFPLLAARSHNLLLHELCRLRGIETGVFRYGAKVTATE